MKDGQENEAQADAEAPQEGEVLMFGWIKKNAKKLLLVGSLILNALGGAGIIPPVVARTGTTILDAAGD